VILCDIYSSSAPVLHVMNYGHIIPRVHAPAEPCLYFLHINPQHSMLITLLLFLYVHCYCWTSVIGTPVAPDFSMFHSLYPSSLRYLSAPYSLSSRYSIIRYRSGQRLRVLSVSIHSYVEPVISWLSGFSSHDTISVMMTLCILVTPELLSSRLCTVIIRCASRGTLL